MTEEERRIVGLVCCDLYAMGPAWSRSVVTCSRHNEGRMAGEVLTEDLAIEGECLGLWDYDGACVTPSAPPQIWAYVKPILAASLAMLPKVQPASPPTGTPPWEDQQ